MYKTDKMAKKDKMALGKGRNMGGEEAQDRKFWWYWIMKQIRPYKLDIYFWLLLFGILFVGVRKYDKLAINSTTVCYIGDIFMELLEL